MKTCVFPFSRRKGFEWTIRSRSRWNGVRTRHGSSSRSRPSVSYERTARGESVDSSSARTRSANVSATLPATSIAPAYWPSRSVPAPPGRPSEGAGLASVDDHGRADHPGRALRDEERDDVGDLVDGSEPAPGDLALDEGRDPPRVLALPAVPAPTGEEHGARRTAEHANRALREAARHRRRQADLRGLREVVAGPAAELAPEDRRDHRDHAAPTGAKHRKRRPGDQHRRDDVLAKHRVEVLRVEAVERPRAGAADVVDD